MKELIKDILTNNLSSNSKLRLFPREQKLYLNLSKIQAILGPRRVGKTSIMRLCMQELITSEKINKNRLVYFNFEDERVQFSPDQFDLILLAHKELYPEINSQDCYFFFDEVQAAPGWEKFVNRINETITKKIVFTGSNSRVLHTEVNSVLRGRSIAVELLPLSFLEFCSFLSQKPVKYGEERSITVFYFNQYLNQGGYPELIGIEDESLRIGILQEYYNAMILRDIVEFNHLSNFSYIKSLFRLAANSVGQPVSIRRYFNQLKSMGYSVGLNSLYEVMNHAEDAYIFKRIGRYDHSSSKSEKSDKKIYWIDNGLLKAIIGSPKLGKGTLLENCVFLHLYRNFGSLYQSRVFYFSDPSHECDFIVLQDGKAPLPIQVSWSITQLDTRSREIKGLVKACNYLGVQEGLILTYEESEEIELREVKIKVMPTWKWMLD